MAYQLALEDKYLEEIQVIAAQIIPADYQVFAFGSRVTGHNKPNSDLDIGIKSKTNEKIDFNLYLTFKSQLEDTNIPYRIDVVDFDRTDEDFAFRSYKNIFNIRN